MKEKIKKNLGIIIIILAVVIILIIYQFFSRKAADNSASDLDTVPQTASNQNQTNSLSTANSNYKTPIYSYTNPTTDSNGKVDLNNSKIQTAITFKAKLESKLPIYIENFQTINSLKTTLNVYTIPEDPDYLIHIEIYGIDYSDSNILQEGNQNGVAFIDSFNKIKSLLSASGVDIHNVYFVFGAKPYIQTAADGLIQKYKLL